MKIKWSLLFLAWYERDKNNAPDQSLSGIEITLVGYGKTGATLS
jgi:hypothetical protein